jgi:Reprolysin (M12B) family zinc metalloprotease
LKNDCENDDETNIDETIDDDENNRILPEESPFLEERFIELVMVADNKLFQKFNRKYKKLQEYCKDMVNIASLLYRPFNITIVLKGIVVWSENNEMIVPSDSKITIDTFADYYKRIFAEKYPTDIAVLLTANNQGRVLGRVAAIDTMCSPVSIAMVVYQNDIITDSSTLAHEIGHVLSFNHDKLHCQCLDKVCVMAAQASTILETHWSSCSVKQLERKLASGSYQCLMNKPSFMFEFVDIDDDANVFGKCLFAENLQKF